MMDTIHSHECAGAPQDKANGRRVMLWSIAWAGSMLIASALVAFEGFGGLNGRIWAISAAVISTLLGLATVGAYRRLLRETDELRQKIELEALAVALGVGVVGGMGYSLLCPPLGLGEPRIAFVIAAMLIAHAVGVIVGRRHYA